MLNGFRYLVEDAHGRPAGELSWPMLSHARNARLPLKGELPNSAGAKIVAGRDSFFVEYEYLDRAWFNDLRFMLMADGQQLAAADLHHAKKRLAQPTVRLTQPRSLQLIRRWRWLRLCFELAADDGRGVGRIEEPHAISRVRELQADLPRDLGLPAQLFVLFLVCHLIQS